MKKFFQKYTCFILSFAMVFSLMSQPSVMASSITDDLKRTIDDVLQIVTDPDYKTDHMNNRAKVRQIIDQKFNYAEMGRRSLSTEWKGRSNDEKKQFLVLFSQLLENSYASKIEAFSGDEKINYTDEIVKGRYALVKTKVARKDDSYGVDYKMLRIGDKWWIFDFIIEGVSMVRNYQSQFTKIIHKDSFQALLEKMQVKVQNLKNSSS